MTASGTGAGTGSGTGAGTGACSSLSGILNLTRGRRRDPPLVRTIIAARTGAGLAEV